MDEGNTREIERLERQSAVGVQEGMRRTRPSFQKERGAGPPQIRGAWWAARTKGLTATGRGCVHADRVKLVFDYTGLPRSGTGTACSTGQHRASHRGGARRAIGSFAAGLVLSPTNQFDMTEERIKPVVAAVNVGLFIPGRPDFSPSVLTVGGALPGIGILGKVASGYAIGWGQTKLSHLAIGVGMVPRGEVGLIFAQLGLNQGILSPEVFSAVLIMVILTTFPAPPLLKAIFRRVEAHDPGPGPDPHPIQRAEQEIHGRDAHL